MLHALYSAVGRYAYARYYAAPFASIREWLWWKLWINVG